MGSDRKECGDDQVVVCGHRLHCDYGQRGDEERAEDRGAARKPRPESDPERRDAARAEGEELWKRNEPVAAPEQDRGQDADLGARRVPVEPRVTRTGDVSDSVLLAPERGAGQVVEQGIEVERGRGEGERHGVCGARGYEYSEHLQSRISA